MPKLPAVPIPPRFLPQPPPPGTQRGRPRTPLEKGAEAGKSAVDTTPATPYNRWVAITSRCAHLGCPVRWVPASERFICPCHGGVYDLQGVRVGGPPPRPLDRFFTRLHEGFVQVGRRYSVNSELRAFSPRDPGEPVDGIGQYLYPSRPSVRI